MQLSLPAFIKSAVPRFIAHCSQIKKKLKTSEQKVQAIFLRLNQDPIIEDFYFSVDARWPDHYYSVAVPYDSILEKPKEKGSCLIAAALFVESDHEVASVAEVIASGILSEVLSDLAETACKKRPFQTFYGVPTGEFCSTCHESIETDFASRSALLLERQFKGIALSAKIRVLDSQPAFSQNIGTPSLS